MAGLISIIVCLVRGIDQYLDQGWPVRCWEVFNGTSHPLRTIIGLFRPERWTEKKRTCTV